MAATTYEDLVGQVEFPETVSITRHLVDFLQWRFSKHPPGAYMFTGHGPDSEIYISADTPIDPEVVGMRPAITVLRSHAAYQGVGIGDVAYTDLRTGAKVYMDLMPTTMLVNVLSKLPVEADRLAAYVAKQIRGFRDALTASLPELLNIGQRIGISPPSPAGSLVAGDSPDFEWTVVVISVPTFLQTVQTTLPLNKPILNHVRVTGTTAARPATVNPIVPLQGTAVAQPLQPQAAKIAAVSGEALLQTGGNEAQSTQPLTVEIET